MPQDNQSKTYKVLSSVFGATLLLVYILSELIYNSIVLDATSSPHFSGEYITNLSTLGHFMFAVGAVLSIFKIRPLQNLFQSLIFNGLKGFAAAFIFLIVSFWSFYGLSTVLINGLVSHFSDKKYEAYYLANFRYGLSTGLVKYSTFIKPEDQTRDGVATPEAKTLLANSFVLIAGDTKLADDLSEDTQTIGTILAFNSLNTAQFTQKWKQYQDGMATLDKKYEEYLGGKQTPEQVSKDIEKTLEQKWRKYQKGEAELKRKEAKAFADKESNLQELERYFSHKGNSRAEAKYKQSMNTKFGHYINPSKWCEGAICPSSAAYDNVIASEIKTQWKKSSDGLPRGISTFGEFKQNPTIKSKVVKSLKSRSLNIGGSFDYSVEQIKSVMLPKGLTKEEFVRHPQVESKIREHFNKLKVSYNGSDDLYIENKQQFFTQMFFPNIKMSDIRPYIFTKEQFTKDKKAAELGEEALRGLISAPISLLCSAFFCILNIYLFAYRNVPYNNRLIKPLIGATIFLSIIIVIPLLFGSTNKFLSERVGSMGYIVKWTGSIEPNVYKAGSILRAYIPDKYVKKYIPS